MAEHSLFRVRFSLGSVSFDSRNAQKRETKSDTSGHCLSVGHCLTQNFALQNSNPTDSSNAQSTGQIRQIVAQV